MHLKMRLRNGAQFVPASINCRCVKRRVCTSWERSCSQWPAPWGPPVTHFTASLWSHYLDLEKIHTVILSWEIHPIPILHMPWQLLRCSDMRKTMTWYDDYYSCYINTFSRIMEFPLLEQDDLKTAFSPPLRWRHNGRDGVSYHQPYDCLLNRLFRHRSNKTSKLRVTGLCVGNSPVPG